MFDHALCALKFYQLWSYGDVSDVVCVGGHIKEQPLVSVGDFNSEVCVRGVLSEEFEVTEQLKIELTEKTTKIGFGTDLVILVYTFIYL